MVKKILFIGRAGVGKTSIMQVIFEGKDPKNLILFPLVPTRGILSSVYKWMDLELGVFDTSGQELLFILENEDELQIFAYLWEMMLLQWNFMINH